MGARDLTPAEERYINSARTPEDGLKRAEQVLRPAESKPAIDPNAPPASSPRRTGGWALYREPAKQIRGTPTIPAAAPVLVELRKHSAASPSRGVRERDRLPASWAGVEYPSGKPQPYMRACDLTDIEETHPLVIAELARRAAITALIQKRNASELMFKALKSVLEGETNARAFAIDAYLAAGGEWDESERIECPHQLGRTRAECPDCRGES